MNCFNPFPNNPNKWTNQEIEVVRDVNGLMVELRKVVDGRTYIKEITRTDCVITNISEWKYTC